MATAAGDGSASTSASASADDDLKLLEAAIKETVTPSSSDGAGSSDKGVHVQSYELLDTKDDIRYWRVTSRSGAKLFVRTGEGKHELSFKSVVEPYLTSHGCKQPHLHGWHCNSDGSVMAVYSLLTGYHVLSPERLRKEPVTAVAAMQHLARYSHALACVPASLIPEWVPKMMNPWDQADSLHNLCTVVAPRVRANHPPYPFLSTHATARSSICAALDVVEAHSKRIAALRTQLCHGDMNPSNIMVAAADDTHTAGGGGSAASSGHGEGAGGSAGAACGDDDDDDGDATVETPASDMVIIDFTPYNTTDHVYAALVPIYWTHIYTEAAQPLVNAKELRKRLSTVIQPMLEAYVAEWRRCTTSSKQGRSSSTAGDTTAKALELLPVLLLKLALRMVFTQVIFADEAATSGEAAPGFVTEKETLRYCDIVSVVLTCQDDISVVSKDLLQSFCADSAST